MFFWGSRCSYLKFQSNLALHYKNSSRVICAMAASGTRNQLRSSSPDVVCTATASSGSAQQNAIRHQAVFFTVLVLKCLVLQGLVKNVDASSGMSLGAAYLLPGFVFFWFLQNLFFDDNLK